MAEKECLNYKDRIVLRQNGRWYSLYADGSLIHKNMNRDGGIMVYFSFVKTLKKMEEKHV